VVVVGATDTATAGVKASSLSMPCPLFSPSRLRSPQTFEKVRLPLIEEYDGTCKTTGAAVPEGMLHACCNHGYARGICHQFPAQEERAAIRYTVVERTSDALELLCVEEARHEPVRWFKVEYLVSTGEVRGDWNSGDNCLRAQAEAFCRSYVARFPIGPA
jgi:hypothetical protein